MAHLHIGQQELDPKSARSVCFTRGDEARELIVVQFGWRATGDGYVGSFLTHQGGYAGYIERKGDHWYVLIKDPPIAAMKRWPCSTFHSERIASPWFGIRLQKIVRGKPRQSDVKACISCVETLLREASERRQ